MARLLPCLSFGPSSPFASTHSISPVPILVLRLQRHIIPQPRSFNGVRVSSPSSLVDRRVLIARASSETDGNEGGEPGDTPPEQSQEAVSASKEEAFAEAKNEEEGAMAAIEDEEAQECIISDGVDFRLEFFSSSPLHFLHLIDEIAITHK
ncbi:hypothetical protein ZIOFF_023586 [Zingiber officinale]|uniref:Uncharacterized protein n=1 Tax=Zingiber officinale TaxID=94328 RepID=A0A8J5LIL4_ZINOF|nr:hypothetical protein ZIOFF_023586 [Zingiber officinale]